MSLISSQIDYLEKTDQEELKEQKHLLKDIIDDPALDDGMRLRALHLLGRLGDTESRRFLHDQAKKEHNPWIKREIQRILTSLKTGETAKPTLGIIFDVDGTLIDKSKTKIPVHMAVLEEVGIKIDESDTTLIKIKQRGGSSNKEILGTVLAKYNALDKLNEALNIRDNVKAKIYKTFTAKDLPLMPGARNLLEHLQKKRERGEVRLATAGTGQVEIVDHDFKIHNLHKYFDVIIALDAKNGLRKRPHPDIFIEAIQQLEKKFAVEKENTVIVDDLPEAGLKSLTPVIAIAPNKNKIKILENRYHQVIYDLGTLNIDIFHQMIEDHWKRTREMGEEKWRAELSQMIHGKRLTEEEKKGAYQIRIHFDNPPAGTLQWIKIPVLKRDLEDRREISKLKQELARTGEKILIPKVYALIKSGEQILFLKKENKLELLNDFIPYNKDQKETLLAILENLKIKYKEIKPLPFLGGEKNDTLRFLFLITVKKKAASKDSLWLSVKDLKKLEKLFIIDTNSLEVVKEFLNR